MFRRQSGQDTFDTIVAFRPYPLNSTGPQQIYSRWLSRVVACTPLSGLSDIRPEGSKRRFSAVTRGFPVGKRMRTGGTVGFARGDATLPPRPLARRLSGHAGVGFGMVYKRSPNVLRKTFARSQRGDKPRLSCSRSCCRRRDFGPARFTRTPLPRGIIPRTRPRIGRYRFAERLPRRLR